MRKLPSEYAQRIAHLSSKIFSEPTADQAKRARKVLKVMSEEPYYKKDSFAKYYPPIFAVDNLMKRIREYGLYVNEHLDFREEMQRQRAARGKAKN